MMVFDLAGRKERLKVMESDWVHPKVPWTMKVFDWVGWKERLKVMESHLAHLTVHWK